MFEERLWEATKMKREKKMILYILKVLVVAIGCYFIGYKVAYDQIENNQTSNQSVTFYAKITDITDNIFSVQGIELNDINYRGEFGFKIIGETELVWRGTPMNISEFDVGDYIAITFTGEIQETYPAYITEIVKIQLLDDEK